MQLKTYTRVIILLGALVGFMGCGEPLDPSARPASCRGAGTSIVCEQSLDACIVEGQGSCHVGDIGVFGDLTLSSSGSPNNTYAVQQGSATLTGSWGRVDRTVQLVPEDGNPDITIDLIEDGVCQ